MQWSFAKIQYEMLQSIQRFYQNDKLSFCNYNIAPSLKLIKSPIYFFHLIKVLD